MELKLRPSFEYDLKAVIDAMYENLWNSLRKFRWK